MPGYKPTQFSLSPKQIQFVRSRVHWGSHLPNDVLDGLTALERGRVPPPERAKLNLLFTSLTVLERSETPDGHKLDAENMEDKQIIVSHISTVKNIIHDMCGWSN